MIDFLIYYMLCKNLCFYPHFSYLYGTCAEDWYISLPTSNFAATMHQLLQLAIFPTCPYSCVGDINFLGNMHKWFIVAKCTRIESYGSTFIPYVYKVHKINYNRRIITPRWWSIFDGNILCFALQVCFVSCCDKRGKGEIGKRRSRANLAFVCRWQLNPNWIRCSLSLV